MKISILASGSKGNCTYIEGNCGAILIDAGCSAREIFGNGTRPGRLQEAGGRKELIDAIFVTHEHTDHISGLNPIGNTLEKPVYGSPGTMAKVLERTDRKVLYTPKTIRYGESVSAAEFTVTSIKTSHDAEEPCGYLIEEDSTWLFYCTDTGIVTDTMLETISLADGVVLESNHCPVMLRDGPYPAFLKRRIASDRGHLSNKAAGDLLNQLGDRLQLAILAHISEENNRPGLALRTAHEALGLHAEGVELFAASSVDREGKEPVRKERGKLREHCIDRCWRYSFTL